MGLFSRKDSSATGARTGSRPSVSSEAQARELRVRARRRLIGALALVMAAVIVVPMLFDADLPEEQALTPVVVPMVVAPAPDAPLTPDVSSGMASAGGVMAPTPVPEASRPAPPPAPAPVTPPAASAPPATPPARPATTPEASRPAPEPAPAPAKPAPAPPSAPRTDDGSVALALLEGRKPRPSSPAASAPAEAPRAGSFVIQIAAYTTSQDAAARRDKLLQSGVTNAYVETAQAGGKSAYRLRVGPFSTREAAQATQTRLRALGDYKDAFITTK